jgi:putative zinc finger/helix-turn-helix YgiT family protein
MKCLNCDSTSFEQKKVRIKTDYNGESFEVLVPSFVCAKCQEQLMNSKQMNVLRQAAVDGYRQKYSLLTSQEIISLRKKLDMSQREFARYLDVGEASVKRWETYYAQEKAMDEHIRIKSDISSAENNLFEVSIAVHQADEFSGNREFSWDRFSNATIILIQTCKSPLFINKALFYLDFLHFKLFGYGITGSRYAKLEYGPCPDDYKVLFKKMIKDGYIGESKGHELKVLKAPDWKIFDDDEQTTINEILEYTKKDHGQKLYDLSHNEEAYKKVSMFEAINYNFAKKLLIK